MDTTILIATMPIGLLGMVNLLYPRWSIRWIEARMAAGDDRFLDEQRTYAAYPWIRDARLVRLSGAGIVLVQAVGWGLHFT